MDEELRLELLRLETALASGDEAAFGEGGYAAALHEDFEEFGASGRRWTRDETLGALRVAPASAVEILDFRIARLSDAVVLATFAIADHRPTRRSSLWVHDQDHWRLRFHQGTPT
jgi:ribonuclease HI